MTDLLDAPVQATAPHHPSARRGSRLLVVALAVGAILLFALAGLRAAQDTLRLGAVTPGIAGSAPAVTLPTYGVTGMHVIGYEHGESAVLTLPISNRGLLPLTVESVDLGGGLVPLLSVRDVTGLPLTLSPGETGSLQVVAELANCRFFHEREVQNYAGFELGVSLLGRRSTRWVAYDRPLMVHSPMIVGCPERKLDREQNDRSDLTRAG